MAAGVRPLTSPPYNSGSLGKLENYDLLYFRLHGFPKRPGIWFGEIPGLGLIPALEAHNVEGADLTDAVIVIANCYSATDSLVSLFYRAGAQAVIAGEGPNVAASNRLVGADLLVKWLILGWPLGIERALQLARMRLALTSWRESDRDARAFRIIDKMEVT